MRQAILSRPDANGRLTILLAALALIALVAYLHVITGSDYEFYVFFAPSVLWVAWSIGQRAGACVALAAVGAWLLSDHALNPAMGAAAIVFNGISRLLVYGGGVWLLTRLREVLERESRLSRQDTLTHLPNRREFSERGRQALGQAQREGSPITAAFIDLDRFKEVNDTHGHETGDALLISVAGVLAARLRSSDIAARLGGDEFALLLPGMGGATAGIYIDELRQRLLAKMAEHGWPVTFSIGVASCDRAPLELKPLLAEADRLMYRAKESGRDRVLQGDLHIAADAAGEA